MLKALVSRLDRSLARDSFNSSVFITIIIINRLGQIRMISLQSKCSGLVKLLKITGR
jgi:hypothetical protein